MPTPLRLRSLLAVLALACGYALPAAHAASLNAKTGAWEMTITMRGADTAPADTLAKMTPEQRAKIEQALKARAGKPMTRVEKSCVTQQELDHDELLDANDDDDDDKAKCTTKVLTRSATKVELQRTCAAPRVSTTHMTIEAPTPERLSAKMDREGADGAGKMHAEISGRWLGASCKGIED